MKPDHTLTLIQFRDAWREDYLSRSGNQYTVSTAHYNRLYPPMSRYRAWYYAIEAAVKAGEIIRRQVCDDLYRRAPLAYRALVHDWGTAWLPAGYSNPDIRKGQR